MSHDLFSWYHCFYQSKIKADFYILGSALTVSSYLYLEVTTFTREANIVNHGCSDSSKNIKLHCQGLFAFLLLLFVFTVAGEAFAPKIVKRDQSVEFLILLDLLIATAKARFCCESLAFLRTARSYFSRLERESGY